MAILRCPLPADNFTIISNVWLRDMRLSWKAKGLLAYIASHHAGHRLSTAQIHAAATDGPDAVRTAIVELETAGYLHRIELRDEKGHRTGTDYELREPPARESPDGKTPTGDDQAGHDVSAGGSQSGKSQQGESGTKKTTPREKTSKTPEASPRGTRLPEGWTPDQELLDWCAADLVPGGRWGEASREFVRREHEKFSDYWHAKTGQNATKRDWRGTWRNWMRRAFERYPGSAVRPVSSPPAPFPTASERNAARADRQRAQAELAQELIDQGVDGREAWKRAGEEIDRNGMDTCLPTGYIEGQVIQKDGREVTAT